jgi:hypothetical protein
MTDGTKSARELPELTKVTALELAETPHGSSEAVTVSGLCEPGYVRCLFDERCARLELVHEFVQHAMMPFFVFEDELREVTDWCIW